MFSKIKAKFFSGASESVFKGMLTLLVGAGLARIVGLISIPILSRIYSPEDYGVLALYTAFIAVLVPIMTLRYVQAIPLPKTDVMAFNLFVLCFKLIIFFTLVVAVVLTFLGEQVLGWFNMQALIPWRWLIVLGVAGTALYELFSLWATRKKQYKTIAKTQFTQSLIGDIVRITLGLLAFKPSGMIIGQFLSQSAGITSFIKDARTDFKVYIPKVRRSKQKFAAKYYQDFVWFRLPSQFLMVLSVEAPIIMMAALYSAESVGQFGLAKMALMVPSSLIGASMSKAYYAEIAAIGKNGYERIKKITWEVQKKTLIFASPPFIVLAIFSPEIFKLIFGEEWVVAGQYAQILSPYMLIMLTSTPLVQALNILGSQRVFLIINVVRIISLLVLFFFVRLLALPTFEFVVWFTLLSILYALFQTGVVLYYINRAVKF